MISNLNMISRATRTENRSREANGWGGREKCPLGVPSGQCWPYRLCTQKSLQVTILEKVLTPSPLHLCFVSEVQGDTERTGGQQARLLHGPPPSPPDSTPGKVSAAHGLPSWDQPSCQATVTNTHIPANTGSTTSRAPVPREGSELGR